MVTDKNLKVIDGRSQTTYFGDIVTALAFDKGHNKRSLAVELECSPSTLTLIGKGERKPSEKLLTGISKYLGGTTTEWRKIFDETKDGSPLPVSHYRELLAPTERLDRLPGAHVRRLRGSHLRSILTRPGEHDLVDKEGLAFGIDEFELSRVQVTSYDTVIGSIVRETSGSVVDVEGEILIPPKTSVLAKSKEAIILPSFMEADVHPATSLAKKHLIVSGGPIIDPGFDDFLTAAIYNPTQEEVRVSATEPFLTLRFWLHEVD